MKYATLSAALLAGADARMWFGSCPTVNWEVIDTSRFAGNWYEDKRDSFMTMDMGQRCSTAVYRARSDNMLDVQYRTYVPMMLEYAQSPVMQMSCDGNNGCSWTNEDKTEEQRANSKSNDWGMGILATDYDNWHIFYGCGSWW